MFRDSPHKKLGLGKGLTPIIKWLVIVNVAVFIIQSIDRSGYFTSQFGLSTRDVITVPAIWQVFTYQFLHGGFFHIFFNMFVLWMFGSEVEVTLGSKRFLRFYLLCGTGAGIITVIIYNVLGYSTLVIGASGATLGVLVAFAVMAPNRIVYLYFLFPIKVKYMVMIFIGITLLSAYSGSRDGVAHFTHLGGALIGFLYMKSNWRFSSFTSKFRGLKSGRRFKKQMKEQQSTDKLMEEVDQILDKISRNGYENLSEKEKKLLERASDALSRRKD
jgi:rhomboid family protein